MPKPTSPAAVLLLECGNWIAGEEEKFRAIVRRFSGNFPAGKRDLAGAFRADPSVLDHWADGTEKPNVLVQRQVVKTIERLIKQSRR